MIVGTCYCYYSDNHIDDKLGISKGKIKLSAAIISGVFLSLLSIKVAKMDIPGIELAAVAAFLAASGQTVVATLVALLPEAISKKLRSAMAFNVTDGKLYYATNDGSTDTWRAVDNSNVISPV